jgi:ABC-type antimicrobial peptide transport system permease subunit
MVHTWFSPSWVVRRSGWKPGIASEMQRAVQSVDPLLPFAKFRTLDDVRGETLAMQRAQAMLLSVLAALALVLAAVGLYGLVANSVTARTRELGIRLALGATAPRAVAVAAGPGIALALVGVVIGLGAARVAARVVQQFVWGVTIGDPLTFAVTAAVVFAVAAIASLVPALRIVRLNPIRALRQT